MLTTKLLSQGYQKKQTGSKTEDVLWETSWSSQSLQCGSLQNCFWCFASDAPLVDFPNPGHTLLPIFPSFRPMGMVGEAYLPSNAYYPRTLDYTLCSGVHVCWSEHSDSSFVYAFMSLDYGFGTMTATTSSSTPLLLVPRKGYATRFWYIFGIYTYIYGQI